MRRILDNSVSSVYREKVKKFNEIINKWYEKLKDKNDDKVTYVMRLTKDYPCQFKYELNNKVFIEKCVIESGTLVVLLNFDYAKLSFLVSAIGCEVYREYDSDFAVISVSAEDLEDVDEQYIFLSKEELIKDILRLERKYLLKQEKKELVDMILGYKALDYKQVKIENDTIIEAYTYDNLLDLHRELRSK